MAGANGINKYALVNREGQFQSLQSYGTIFHEENLNLDPITGFPRPTFTVAAMGAQQFIQDWVITAATPIALTAPVNTALNALFDQSTKPESGNSFTVQITNSDSVDHTVTFGAGYQVNPSTLTIPALSQGYITIQVTNAALCQFKVIDFQFGLNNNTIITPGLGNLIPPGVVNGDLLEWSGLSWLPSSSLTAVPGILNQRSSTNNSTTKLFNGAPLIINTLSPNTPGVINYPFQGANDSIVDVHVPTINSTGQSGILADNFNTYPSATNVLLNQSSNFTSNYLAVAGFAVCPAPNALWHYLATTGGGPGGGPPPPNGVYGLDVGGQYFGVAYNVASDSKIKKNIEPVKLDSKSLRDFQVSRYHLNQQDDKSDKHLGLIAENVKKILPSAVSDSTEQLVSHVGLLPLLSAVIGYAQDLEARLTQLESKLIPSLPTGSSSSTPSLKTVQV